jgi:ABC-type glycerol-3-phosphate transport system permease component
MSRLAILALGFAGLAFIAASLLALAGPFEPVPVEKQLAERATSVVDSLRAIWRGEPAPDAPKRWTLDRWLAVGSTALAALALALAAFGFARGAPARETLAVAVIAGGAIGFRAPLVALTVVVVAGLAVAVERRLRGASA